MDDQKSIPNKPPKRQVLDIRANNVDEQKTIIDTDDQATIMEDVDDNKTIIDDTDDKAAVIENIDDAKTIIDEDLLTGNAESAQSPIAIVAKSHIAQPPKRYKNQGLLGEGGMGMVTMVTDQILQRNVAMKAAKSGEITPAVRHRFIREARITGILEHPNIIPIYDLSTRDLYFTMRMIQGDTLSTIISKVAQEDAQYRQYTLVRLLQIMQNICYALEFAHAKGIIHRDLKPDNVMVGAFGEVLVLDWGIAKKLATDEDDVAPIMPKTFDKTEMGTLLGTPIYMSPEQASGKVDIVDELSDLYTLGAILYVILTHALPFQAPTIHALLEKIKKQPLALPKYNSCKQPIPREIMAVAAKALAKDKADRYASVKEFREDIQRFLEGRSLVAAPDNLFGKTTKIIRRNPGISISVAAGLFLLAIAYHFFAVQITSEELKNRLIVVSWISKAKKLQQQLSHLSLQKEHLQKNLLELERRRLNSTLDKLRNIDSKIDNQRQNLATIYQDILQLEKREDIKKALAMLYMQNARQVAKNSNTRRFEAINHQLQQARQLHPVLQPQIELLRQRISSLGTLTLETPFPIAILQCNLSDKPRQRQLAHQVASGKHTLQLAQGSYVVKSDKHSWLFPLFIESGTQASLNVRIPKNIPLGMVFVPGGSFLAGAHIENYQRPKPVKMFPFFIDRHEVTIEQYLRFYRANKEKQYMAQIMIAAGCWEPLWDENLQLRFGLTADCPVFGITHEAATAYCQWRSQITGHKFALPLAGEWEKAARGVDGRLFPWGNRANSTWTNVRQGMTAGRVMPIGSMATDCSVYGVKDLAGNVAEWTATTAATGGIVVKGAHCHIGIDFAKTHIKTQVPPQTKDFIGFRCVCRSVKW